jgi:hypothetical protein
MIGWKRIVVGLLLAFPLWFVGVVLATLVARLGGVPHLAPLLGIPFGLAAGILVVMFIEGGRS